LDLITEFQVFDSNTWYLQVATTFYVLLLSISGSAPSRGPSLTRMEVYQDPRFAKPDLHSSWTIQALKGPPISKMLKNPGVPLIDWKDEDVQT
jgi:hypothetical protein